MNFLCRVRGDPTKNRFGRRHCSRSGFFIRLVFDWRKPAFDGILSSMKPNVQKKGRVRYSRFDWTTDLLDLVMDAAGLPGVAGSAPAPADVIRTIATAVKSLSDTFLHARSAGPSPDTPAGCMLYGADAELRAAYTAYYLLANAPKIVETLESALIDWQSVRSVLDIGTGPGTALTGLLITRHRSGTDIPLDLIAIDHSRDFLKLAETIIRKFRDALNTSGNDRFLCSDIVSGLRAADYNSGEKPVDMVIAANVLAELPPDSLDIIPAMLAGRLRPGGYAVLLEPARRIPARRLLTLRDRLCAAGWRTLFPCPGDYPCPALGRTRDWCHHRLEWTAPDLVKAVDRLTGMHKYLLNFTGLVLRKPEVIIIPSTPAAPAADGMFTQPAADESFDQPPVDGLRVSTSCRVISDIMPQKGRFEALLCGDFDGRQHLLTAVLEKKRINDYNKAFLELARYDRIRIDGAAIRGNRLVLSEASRLTVEVDDGDQE